MQTRYQKLKKVRSENMINTHAMSPLHYSIIQPLLKWKILSLDDLQKAVRCPGTRSNLYKKIDKLEESHFIGSFIDPFTKKKFIYLRDEGMKFFGEDQMTPINKENIYHDSISSEFAYQFEGYPFVKKVMMEDEIIKAFPLIGHRPDALIEGEHKKNEFRMAFEMELSIKSKKRILETFNFYNESQYFNNVLYIFGLPQIYETYVRVFRESERHFNKDKFLFLFLPELYRRIFNVFGGEVTHGDRTTTLGKIFLSD
jgi:hypothetical protein